MSDGVPDHQGKGRFGGSILFFVYIMYSSCHTHEYILNA